MLDNNEFFFAEGGWTCHCDACTKAFREYVGRRCGVDGTKRLFGVPPNELRIPSTEGPLFALWVHWRNRVWAEINESFRAKLRETDPEILLFANTQYLFDTGMLGTDYQYEREDVVLSESCNLNGRQMSAKMVLGHAVAEGRPLWNYIGTFAKPDDYTGLLPAATIRPMITSTIAHGARPWIVDGFDEGRTDVAARSQMSRLLGWYAKHPDLYRGEPWAEVATLISLDSRNVLHRPLIPAHVAALQSSGTPVVALRDDNLTAEMLKPFRVIVAETSMCLSGPSAAVLAKWVREGGELLASPDMGDFDELGRRLPASTMWSALRLDSAPITQKVFGRGSVTAVSAAVFTKTAIDRTLRFGFQTAGASPIEVVPYRSGHSLVLQLLRHEPAKGPMKLWLPEGISTADKVARQFTPGAKEVRVLRMTSGPEFTYVELAEVPDYCVIEVGAP